jgi:hypothetical protein
MPMADPTDSKAANDGRRRSICGALLVALVALTFCLDFVHGIGLGQHQVAFHPIYRLRQSVAVALSRMHEPPLHGYLAYRSIVDTFTRKGFALQPQDVGTPLSVGELEALYKDNDRLDRMLQEANATVVDNKLPPQIIAGNELAYADYAYLSFVLFGIHMSSLYYFWFLLLGISCVLFVMEFRSSLFPMLLLATYLGGLWFIQTYAQIVGPAVATLSNSRLFEALSLLPAMHLFLLVWRRAPLGTSSLWLAIVQSIILAFIVDCRITARWQIAVIVAAAVCAMLADAWRRRSLWPSWRRESWDGIWAAGVAVVILAAHMTLISASAARQYGQEPKYHIIWHEVLRGLLGSSLELQREYLGREDGLGSPHDTVAYDAVIKDLTERNVRSSGVFVQDGKVIPDLNKGWADYERFARDLSIRMVLNRPRAAAIGLLEKCREQYNEYFVYNALVLTTLAVPALITAMATIFWLCSGARRLSVGALLGGSFATLLVMAFATIPPFIAPSPLSVGTLLVYLLAIAIAGAVVAALATNAIGIALTSRRRSCEASVPQPPA